MDDQDIDITDAPFRREVVAREVSEQQGVEQGFGSDLYVAIQIPALNFEIIIPADEFSKLTDRQVKAMVYMFENYLRSPELTAALQHLSNGNISALEIRVDDAVHLPDGTERPFFPTRNGDLPRAEVNYDSVAGDTSRTDIVDRSKVIITFNSQSLTTGADPFIDTLIHEILHPVAPDVEFINPYLSPDHLEVITNTNRIFDTFFKDGVESIIPFEQSSIEQNDEAAFDVLVGGYVELGLDEGEAVAFALNLDSVFGADYMDFVDPPYVPEGGTIPPNVDSW